MESSIQLHHVTRSYRLGRATVPAVQQVNATFGRGEFTAVAGPSGSGKTTLLNLIGCLDQPDAGRIVIAGTDVTDRPLHALARLRNEYFGYIFQTFNLIPVLTAYENVEFPLRLSGVGRADRRLRTEGILERVGLRAHGSHRPNELSGGQRQRVAIARALVTNPLAVLADEPTANLDSRTATEIVDLMSALNRTQGVTFIFSTHDPQIIRKAGRVLWMTDGAVHEERKEVAS
jgi:putative ABC transport system ATP-binding protein